MIPFPKNSRQNLLWRMEILKKAREDMGFREKVRRLYHEDILFAFNAFYYTLDVRKRPLHNLPFATWPYQDRTILDLEKAIREGHDLAIEKSRDMGASWMVLLVILHEWHDPKGGGDYLVGSRVEDYVDRRGDMRTLFEKLRYTFYKLPMWLRPKGFNRRSHDTFAKLVNPETGSSITGESNNPNFSTGGRYAAIFYDEFAKWKDSDTSAWTAGGDASPSRIAGSTHFGEGGQFWHLTVDGRTKVIKLHWSLHPEKSLGISCIWPPPNEGDSTALAELWLPEERLTSPWYEKECERRSPNEVAQELDMEAVGSGSPVFQGKALASIIFYRKIPDEPVAWGQFDGLKEKISVAYARPRDPEGRLVIYEEPTAGEHYAIGVDVVEGVEGGDYAVITVGNRRTKSVAAVFWGRPDEITLAYYCLAVGVFYSPGREIGANSPWMGVETTGPGLATFDKLVELGYVNLFMALRYDVVSQQLTSRKGWRTDLHSKNELIGGINSYLIHRSGRPNSHRLLGELVTFVRGKTGAPKAKNGCWDDMVMSFGIMLQVDQLSPPPYEELKEKVLGREDVVGPVRVLPPEDEDRPQNAQEWCLKTVIENKAMPTEDDFFEVMYG